MFDKQVGYHEKCWWVGVVAIVTALILKDFPNKKLN